MAMRSRPRTMRVHSMNSSSSRRGAGRDSLRPRHSCRYGRRKAAGSRSVTARPHSGSCPPDGRAQPQRIPDVRAWPYTWSTDGTAISIYVVNETTARDILILRSAGGGWEVEDFRVTNANERSPAISPDGRWLAYVSDESSQDEIYLTSFATGEGKWLVSSNGGREPAWSPRVTSPFSLRVNMNFERR